MQFVYPSFLFALSAILIPILIHLFQFRRYKKFIFSDIRFLKQVEEQSKSRQRLKEILILITRILAIALMVLAFSRPFIPQRESQVSAGQKAVSIYIDNSFSMLNTGRDGELLETARNKARAIVEAYGRDAEFQLSTNDFDGWQQRWIDKDEALDRIDDIKVSPSGKTLQEIQRRQAMALEQKKESRHLVYMVSDFQRNSGLPDLQADSVSQIQLIATQPDEIHNLFIDSAWLMNPVVRSDEPVRIAVRIQNSSDANEEGIAVSLRVNGIQKALHNFSCDANDRSETELSFIPASGEKLQCELSITDHPITFDDKLFFVLSPVAFNPVLCINGHASNEFIKTVYSGDKAYSLKEISQTQPDFSTFRNYSLIILNEPTFVSSGLIMELEKFVSQGGQLLIIPSADKEEARELNTLLNQLGSVNLDPVIEAPFRVDKLNLADPLFAGVYKKIPSNPDLPVIRRLYRLSRSRNTAGSALMSLNNGFPFLWKGRFKQGSVIVLASSLTPDWSNLPQHALFVPLMLKMAWGTKHHKDLYSLVGMQQWIEVENGEERIGKPVQLWNTGNELSGEVTSRGGKPQVYIGQELKEAGIYKLGNKSTKKADDYIAFNYSRKESDMKFYSMKELKDWSKGAMYASVSDEDRRGLKQHIKEGIEGFSLWRWCLFFAILLFLTEIGLLRLMR